MLPADVGAAPAAATRYQGTSSTPPATAGRERPASGADPFGDLVDQYAGDAEPASTGGHPPARPVSRQAMTAQPQVQAPVADAPAAGTTTPTVTVPPRHDDEPPAVVATPAVTDDARTDLIVPGPFTPFNLPQTAPVATGTAHGGEPVGTDATPQATASTAPQGTLFLPRTWHQPAAQTPAAGSVEVDGAHLDDTAIDLAAVEQPTFPAGMPPDDVELPDGMPPEAASPEVLAALRAARAARPTGEPGLGAPVSAVASGRAARASQPGAPAAPSDPRAVVMAAVRQALSQSVDGMRPTTTPATAPLPEGEPSPEPSPVPQPAVAAPVPVATPAVAAGAVQGAGIAVADDTTAAPQPQVAAPGMAVTLNAEQVPADAASARAPRHARQVSGEPQAVTANAPLNEAVSIDETVQASPVRKAVHEDAPVQAARPTARAAQAIAAFHAAAAIGATTTPAAVNAAVAGAAVSSTPLLDAELPTQLIRAIRVQFDQGSGEARIRLNPGFLGGVTVGVQIDGSSVTASLQAASADVREWMRTNESVLRQALADQGLQLDRLVIVDEDAPASADDQDARPREEREQQAPRRQPRTADQGTFELVF